MTDFASTVKLIMDGGAIVVLAWMIWGFTTGNLIPKATEDKIIASYRERLDEKIQAEKEFYREMIAELRAVPRCKYSGE